MVRQGLLVRATLGVAACGLTALVYIPALDHPFVLDDRRTIVLNPSLVALTDVRGILAYDARHPLVNASFALDRAFAGGSSFGAHITNGILHLIVVAVLFGLLTRRAGSTSTPWAGFVAAAAFAINPLTARSVVYASARADLLFAAGLLVTAMLARRAIVTRQTAAVIGAVVAASLTLMSIPWGMAPHGPQRAYLFSLVAFAIAGRLAAPLLDRSRVWRVAGVLAVAGLIALTERSLVPWGDPIGLWRDDVARHPGAADAHAAYANALDEAGRCDEASVEYGEALRIDPAFEQARRGLARCQAR